AAADQADTLDQGLRSTTTRLNILLPSLARGGVQRIVMETVQALSAQRDLKTCVYVLARAPQRYSFLPGRNVTVKLLDRMTTAQAMRKIALEVASSETPLLYAPLIPDEQLNELLSLGVETVPVVHAVSGRSYDVPAYNHPLVPYVLATSVAAAKHLFRAGCVRPVVPLRHEVQRPFIPEKLAIARREIRD